MMKMYITQPVRNQKGFTLTELLIAMALFSFVMLAISMSILQLFNIYQSTVGVRNTQQAGRLAAEELTRASRGAGFVTMGTSPAGYGQTLTNTGAVATEHNVICFYTSSERDEGIMFYTFTTGQNQQNLYKQRIGKADTCTRPASAAGEQIGDPSEVSFLRFSAVMAGTDVVTFRITIATTTAILPADLTPSSIDPTNATCSQAQAAEWCSITNLNTSIVLRELDR